ncbi:MAG: hypothetical protein OXI97_12630 [Acidimicrobiaceae bacterium]|nr:hypothetical protein [Acidimicrobiaceae bacterium]
MGLLLAGSVLAVVPAGGAGAQSALPAQRTLVSNTGQTLSNSQPLHSDYAQAFTTGSNSAGYSLRSAEISFFPAVDRIGSSDLAVSVHADSSGQPGASLGTLTGPPVEPSNGVSTVAFTSDGIDLNANTTYFLMIDMAASYSTSGLVSTDSDGEDAGALPGWSIANGGRKRVWNSTGQWGSTNNLETLRVALGGTVKCPSMFAFSNAGVSVSYSGDGVPVSDSAYAHTASGECAVLVEEGAEFTLSFTAGAPRYVRLDLSDDVERVDSSGVGWLSTFFTGASAGSTLTFRAGADAASVGGVGHARVAFSPWGSTRNRMYVPVVIVPADDGPDLSLPEVGVTAFHTERTEGQSAAFRLVRPEGFTGPVKVRVSQQGDFVLKAQRNRLGERTWASTNEGFTTVDDNAWEPDGQITVELLAGDGYRVSSSQGSATVRIRDDDDLAAASRSALTLDSTLTAGVAADQFFRVAAGTQADGWWHGGYPPRHAGPCDVGVWTGAAWLDHDGGRVGSCVKGAEDTYELVLSGDPGEPVTVTARVDGDGVGVCQWSHDCNRMRRSRSSHNHRTVTFAFDSDNWDSARTVTVYRYPQAAAGTATISHTSHTHGRVGGAVTVTLAGASQYQTVPVPDPPPVVYDTVDDHITDYPDSPTPPQCRPADCPPPHQPDPPPQHDCTAREDIVRLVQGYHNANVGRGGYAGNWARVLAAFGRPAAPPWDTAEPFTAADARTQETHWRGWTPIRIELDRITDCNSN